MRRISKASALTAALVTLVGFAGSAFASVGNFPQQQPPPRSIAATDKPSLVSVGNRPQFESARSQVKVTKNATDAVQQR